MSGLRGLLQVLKFGVNFEQPGFTKSVRDHLGECVTFVLMVREFLILNEFYFFADRVKVRRDLMLVHRECPRATDAGL